MEQIFEEKIVFKQPRYSNSMPAYMSTTFMACDIPGSIAVRVAGLQDVDKLVHLMTEKSGWMYLPARNEVLEVVNNRPLDKYFIVAMCAGTIIGYQYLYRTKHDTRIVLYIENSYQQKGIDIALISKGREFEILRSRTMKDAV